MPRPLEYDLIAACEYGQGENWEIDCAAQRPQGRLFAGLDIGRHKDLTVLWVLEQLGDVLYTRMVVGAAQDEQAGSGGHPLADHGQHGSHLPGLHRPGHWLGR